MFDVVIYGLVDPETGIVRYIGKSTNPKKRLTSHIRSSRSGEKSHKASWIRGLLTKKKKPTLVYLCYTTRGIWQGVEKQLISIYRELGIPLTNMCDGGEGVEKGNIPWNKDTKGLVASNKGSFREGTRSSPETEFREGTRPSPETEFKKGHKPDNVVRVAMLDEEGNVDRVFSSYAEAGRYFGVTYTAVRNAVVKGHNCKGFKWKRIN